MEFTTILFSKENQIATLTINRPDKLNALNKEVIQDLSRAFDVIEADHEVRCVILTGAGPKAFVAGADISEFLSLDDNGGRELAAVGQAEVFNKIERGRVPVIAAVNGFALGGGCELAMACHIRIASETARFGQPEVNLGLIPGYGGTQRLTQLVGKGRAMELCLTTRMVDAQEALAIGLVNKISTPDNLLQDANNLAQVLLTKSPVAMAAVIQAVNAAVEQNGFDQEIQLFGSCFATEDMREGVSAFLEKRKAVFPGR